MNKEEALNFFNGTQLDFVGYYKYRFNYSGIKDGMIIEVSYGGDSSEIYREEYGPTEIFYDSGFEYFKAPIAGESKKYNFSEN
jgi:hypothetical protein